MSKVNVEWQVNEFTKPCVEDNIKCDFQWRNRRMKENVTVEESEIEWWNDTGGYYDVIAWRVSPTFSNIMLIAPTLWNSAKDFLTDDEKVALAEIILNVQDHESIKFEGKQFHNGFSWVSTDQGLKYWKDIYNRIGNNTPTSVMCKKSEAASILQEAKDCLVNRAAERDHEDGERSMEAAVNAFNTLTKHSLTEEQGWLFVAVLKAARAQGGGYKRDDYVDGAAYFALAGEAAEKERGGE